MTNPSHGPNGPQEPADALTRAYEAFRRATGGSYTTIVICTECGRWDRWNLDVYGPRSCYEGRDHSPAQVRIVAIDPRTFPELGDLTVALTRDEARELLDGAYDDSGREMAPRGMAKLREALGEDDA